MPGVFQFVVRAGAILELSNMTIMSSTASPAIMSNGHTVLDQVIMQHNYAASGAAVDIRPGGSCNATASKFLNNHAGDRGGAVHLWSGQSRFSGQDCEFSGNVADKGGAMFIMPGSVVALSGQTVMNQNRALSGGAVQLVQGRFDVTGELHAEGNLATTRRGGGGYLTIYNGGQASLENAHFVRNKVEEGGGNAGYGGLARIEKDGTLLCTNCTIDGSSAGVAGDSLDSAGAVIWMDGGDAIFKGCAIQNCISTSGGVAYMAGGKLNFVDSHISKVEGYSWGGVASVAGGVLTFENSTINQTTARLGGRVFREGGCSVAQAVPSSSRQPTSASRPAADRGSTARPAHPSSFTKAF